MTPRLFLALVAATAASAAEAQLREGCVVSILNRSTSVRPDGSWVLPSVPANVGRVRARATCVRNGATLAGESEFFSLTPQAVIAVPPILFGANQRPPASLRLLSGAPTTIPPGASLQLTAEASFPGGTLADVTAGAKGTNYTSSNPRIATVSEDGLVTAASSGTVLVTALNDGALAMLRVSVVSGGDSDGDGIPDDVELANGLNPNDPVDGLADFDRDGLTNAEELQRGTDLRLADTDGDGLGDGRELQLGTEPLLFDTDGDGIGDGLEVQTGSNPLDPASYNLGQALQALEVRPARLNLVVNLVAPESSAQLQVTGRLLDGRPLDLTAEAGTNYATSDAFVANFGAPPGRVFAGNDGTAVVTVSNAGFTATVPVTVRSFAPRALSTLAILGARQIDVGGDYAYVAAQNQGLVVVDVSNRALPAVVARVGAPTNARDVKVAGANVYVADPTAGLRIFEVGDPTNPVLLKTVDTPGTPRGLTVRGGYAYVADGAVGLTVIDVRDAANAAVVGRLATGAAEAVEVDGGIAVVSRGSSGVAVVDVADPTAPALRGTLTTDIAYEAVVEGAYAYLADYTGSLKVISLANPASPQVVAATSGTLGGYLLGLAKVGRFTFGADIYFVNGVPITDVSDPQSPLVRARLDFPGDATGLGVAADDQYVYLVTDRGELHIGQYRILEDTAGLAPSVTLTAPAPGANPMAGSVIRLAAEAADDVAVAAVVFSADGVPIATDAAEPYEAEYRLPVADSVVLQAAASDYGGNQAQSPPVVVPIAADPVPVVSLAAPAEGATALQGSTLQIQGGATDNVRVAKIEVFVDGTRRGTFTAPSFQLAHVIPLGPREPRSLTILVKAWDNLDQLGSLERTVTILPDPLPVVTIVTPGEGHVGQPGVAFAFEAAASDNVSIAKLTLLADGTTLKVCPGSPCSVSYTPPFQAEAASLTAEARDNLDQSASVSRVVELRNDPPTVQLVTPAEGTSLTEGESLVLEAQAQDDLGIAAVAFLANGEPVATDPEPPYRVTYTVPLGATSLDLAAVASDLGGKTATAARSFSLGADPPPSATLTAPTGASVFEGQAVTFQATANDNVRVVSVSFRVNGTTIRTVYAAPFAAPYVVPVGASELAVTVEARDNLGRTGADGRVYTVTPAAGTLLVEPSGLAFSVWADPGLVTARAEPAPPRGSDPATRSGARAIADSGRGAKGLWPPSFRGDDSVATALQALPLAFEPSPAQKDGRPAFVARTAAGSLVFREREVLLFPRGAPARGRPASPADAGRDTVRLGFRGASPRASLEGLAPSGAVSHYLLGDDASRFRVGVPQFQRLLYRQLYPGVDAVFYGRGRQLEYDLLASPGVDLDRIRLDVDGVPDLALDGAGDLVSKRGGGELRQLRPRAYQVVEGRRQEREARYVLRGSREVGFAVEGYDRSLPLVIDPVLVYSTYLGGSGYDEGTAVAVDAAGSAYVVGVAGSSDFPTVGDGAPTYGGAGDVFVTKLSPDGTSVVYSTYFGGSGPDRPTDVAVSGDGSVFVTGYTSSGNFPVQNAFQPTFGNAGQSYCDYYFSECFDAFVARLDPTGATLDFSTYLGSTTADYAFSLSLAPSGNVWVGGRTNATYFPGAYFSFSSGWFTNYYPYTGGFLTELSPAGAFKRTIAIDSYLPEGVHGVATDAAGNVYVAGIRGQPISTYSTQDDAFVAKYSPAGALLYSVGLGGSGPEGAPAIAVDGAGNALVGASTVSTNLPLVSPLQSAPGPGFLSRIGPTGAVLFTTYTSGRVRDVALDASGALHVAGGADPSLVPVNPMKEADYGDAWVAKLDPAGAAYEYSSALGGDSSDFASGIAVGPDGTLYATGYTYSFPLVQPAQPTPGGGQEAFVARIGRGDDIHLGRTLYSAAESAGSLTIKVYRGDAGAEPATVDYAVEAGTATPPFDFEAVSGTLTFAAGETERSILVPIVDDPISEGMETFSVRLRDPSAGVRLGQGQAEVTLWDDDYTGDQDQRTAAILIRDRLLASGPDWQAATDAPWLQLSSYAGRGPSYVTVVVDPTGLAPGDYSASITVTAAAADSPQTIPVSLGVRTQLDVQPTFLPFDAGTEAGVIRKFAGQPTTPLDEGGWAGGYGGDGGPATAAQLADPGALAADAQGNLFVADVSNFRIRRVASDGTITTVVGTGEAGDSGDGGPATAARIGSVGGLAVDADGRLCFTDATFHRLRRVEADGVVQTLAGTGVAGFGGDGGPAVAAVVDRPLGLVVRDQSIYFADSGNHRVRRIAPDGTIATVAGTGEGGYDGDGGPASEALLDTPTAVAMDGAGTLFVLDAGNGAVRAVEAGGTIESLVAGGSLVDPKAMAVDGNGRLFVADTGQHRVARVAVAGGDVRNVAGDGSAGDGGDDWAAIWARLRLPGGVTLDAQGNLFVSDTANQRVRRVGAMPVFSAEVAIRDLDQPVGPDWQASPNIYWLSLSQSAGRGPSTVTVFVDTAGLWQWNDGSIMFESATGVTPAFLEVQVHVGFQSEGGS